MEFRRLLLSGPIDALDVGMGLERGEEDAHRLLERPVIVQDDMPGIDHGPEPIEHHQPILAHRLPVARPGAGAIHVGAIGAAPELLLLFMGQLLDRLERGIP